MTNDWRATNDRLQQQVDELSEIVDLLQRAVAALQADPPAAPEHTLVEPESCERAAWATSGSLDQTIGPRDLHPSMPLTEGTWRHLLKLAGGAAVAGVAGTG